MIECIDLNYINIKNSEEQKISIANISQLKKIIKNFRFDKLDKFFTKSNILLKKKINKVKFPQEKKNQLNENITIIYGAGFSGKKLYEQIKFTNKKTNIFFIDDNKFLQGKYYRDSPIISYKNFRNKKNYC